MVHQSPKQTIVIAIRVRRGIGYSRNLNVLQGTQYPWLRCVWRLQYIDLDTRCEDVAVGANCFYFAFRKESAVVHFYRIMIRLRR